MLPEIDAVPQPIPLVLARFPFVDWGLSQQQSASEFLAHGSAYPDHPAAVERVETHISWVFLTPRFAYKLKKPVKFDFLDFSTPQQRRVACEEEVRINRRLAPDVYLDVVPITGDEQGELHLGGSGVTLDWVVKMRRLPADRAIIFLVCQSLMMGVRARFINAGM